MIPKSRTNLMISSQEAHPSSIPSSSFREVIEQIQSDSNDTPPDNLDSVLADAMNSLSFNDREKVLHEIHGITEEIAETDEFVEQKLYELQYEISMILETGGEVGGGQSDLPTAAYELAISISPQYVSDRKVLLKFLRADDFNARLAAERLMYHFDLKFVLFGGNKLCQDITQDDLDEDDLYSLQNGSIQSCPVRDRAGRGISCVFPLKEVFKPGSDKAKCMGRICWYTHTAANDEQAEKKGIAIVVYAVGKINFDLTFPDEIPPMIQKTRKALPTKIVSMHLCFSNPLFRHIAEHTLFLFHRKLWAGGKIHQGSQQEVFYSLMSYGIPTDILPVTFNNDIKRTNHLDQLKMMKKKEEYIKQHGKEAGEKCVIIPYLKDILLGKGAPNQSSPGSMRLKMIVDELLPKYDSLEKPQKVKLGQQVVDMIREEGGRFLSKDTGVWMIVPDNVARSRVATMFRNRRKVHIKKQKAAEARRQQQPQEILKFASKTPRLEEDLEGILADAASEFDDGVFTKRTKIDDGSPISIFQ